MGCTFNVVVVEIVGMNGGIGICDGNGGNDMCVVVKEVVMLVLVVHIMLEFRCQ